MRQCTRDCIHAEACGSYADNSTYFQVADCPVYRSYSEFVQVPYVEAFLENIEFAHDCGIPVSPKDDELYELLIKAMPKLEKECVKRFAKFLVDQILKGETVSAEDICDLVARFLEVQKNV